MEKIQMRRILLAVTALSAVLGCATHALAADQPVTMCTGIAKGNYDFVGLSLVQQLGPRGVTLLNTAGSVENLEKVSANACQVGISQWDAFYLFADKNPAAAASLDLARNLYPEFGHLICNKSVNEISDLHRGNTVLVGKPGSGSAVMWDAIVKANKQYGEVLTLPIEGNRALGKVEAGTEASCMLFVTGLKSSVMNEANEFAKSANTLHLTYMRDPALFNLKDAKGRPIYTRGSIPDGTYPGGLQKSGFFSSGKAVDTIMVESVMIANAPYIDANSIAYEHFLDAVKKAMPAVLDRVQPH